MLNNYIVLLRGLHACHLLATCLPPACLPHNCYTIRRSWRWLDVRGFARSTFRASLRCFTCIAQIFHMHRSNISHASLHSSIRTSIAYPSFDDSYHRAMAPSRGSRNVLRQFSPSQRHSSECRAPSSARRSAPAGCEPAANGSSAAGKHGARHSGDASR